MIFDYAYYLRVVFYVPLGISLFLCLLLFLQGWDFLKSAFPLLVKNGRLDWKTGLRYLVGLCVILFFAIMEGRALFGEGIRLLKDNPENAQEMIGTLEGITRLDSSSIHKYTIGDQTSHGVLLQVDGQTFTAMDSGKYRPGDRIRLLYLPESHYVLELCGEAETILKEGTALVSYEEQENMDAHKVFQVDATEDPIFICYRSCDFVCAFDWTGRYLFTITLPQSNGGQVYIRCLDGQLYIAEGTGKYVYLFLYDNLQQVLLRDTSSLENGFFSHGRTPSNATKKGQLVALVGHTIQDREGNVIMTVKSIASSLGTGLWMIVPVIFLGNMVFMFFSEQAKKKPGSSILDQGTR